MHVSLAGETSDTSVGGTPTPQFPNRGVLPSRCSVTVVPAADIRARTVIMGLKCGVWANEATRKSDLFPIVHGWHHIFHKFQPQKTRI